MRTLGLTHIGLSCCLCDFTFPFHPRESQNFPSSRGSVVGVLKAAIGLSGALAWLHHRPTLRPLQMPFNSAQRQMLLLP